ncbi:tripartite tricarboxylate transporter permease [Salarchaeum japonicum]|uniref:Tripartite tricarboxylate transporter permease n=1 Tax=Salarchaeum japonicum TaxID=555573 RepID=A0AAV3T3K8_9EURY|nr:tripartite tricarboxylate transporter permease [Salarchaeum japonicum]
MLEGLRVLLDPALAGSVLAAALCGVLLGTLSGLTPGLHVNTLAVLLAALAGEFPGDPVLVGVVVLTAGVTHSFLDIVPALALGVPDAAMAVTALPGHRLVLAGRGREALRLSALGSASAVVLAFVLGVPVTMGMRYVSPWLDAHLPLVLAGVACALVASERTPRARVGAALGVALSGVLGLAVLDATLNAPLGDGDVLLPLFAGLFGVPVLLAALRGAGVPEQGDAVVESSPRSVGVSALAGSAAGAAVAYVSGVSSAVAATAALGVLPRRGDPDRAYVVATSGVNTSNTIFALYAFVSLGAPHTGVLVALDRSGAPLDLPVFLLAVALAGAVAVCLVVTVGDTYLRVVGNIDHRRVVVAVLALVASLTYVLSGTGGVGVLVAASALGHLPVWFGARRTCLMGVLLVPLAL